MNRINLGLVLALSGVMLAGASRARAQDWPQWRGSNRDGKASGFKAPETWPKELTQKWKMAVGRGDATPAVVGDKLFVFARDDSTELTLCLDAATGKELWKDKYESQAASEPMGQHPGPRSSPNAFLPRCRDGQEALAQGRFRLAAEVLHRLLADCR